VGRLKALPDSRFPVVWLILSWKQDHGETEGQLTDGEHVSNGLTVVEVRIVERLKVTLFRGGSIAY
jgi:hypothetical protein